ncbi:DUF4936 family protein [Undibacterium sp. RuRC25W]|uniref:DUF4936 family protein n=1 Tax=Undibacterium sp. RuRC25W TaxID=3413047 RepID=UPI003BF0804D
MNCYIYFKATIENEDAIIAAEQLLLKALHSVGLILTSLERRPKATDGLHTWMETYKNVPHNFKELLDVAISQTTLLNLQYSERHIEYFLNVDVCA